MKEFALLSNPNIRHTDIITQIVKLTNCQKYLELGVWYGDNISQVKNYCNYCIGVDLEDKVKNKNFKLIINNTDDFFSENEEKFDIIFIDADHSFDSVKKDFINSLEILNKFGIIFLHDTDPLNEYWAQKDFCGDSYKIIDWLEENYPNLNVLTLPITEAGLTLITRKEDRRIYDIKNRKI
jgi:Methyltransferase domain